MKHGIDPLNVRIKTKKINDSGQFLEIYHLRQSHDFQVKIFQETPTFRKTA